MRAALVFAALALGAVAAGCGDDGSTQAVRSTRSHAAAASATPPRRKDPYKASLAYVRCMRRHGIALPDPKRNGDINLTPEDEERIGPPGPRNRKADAACFRYLRGAVKVKPLSRRALARMGDVMLHFASCMRLRGYEFGKPTIRNLSRGRVILFFPHSSRKVRALTGQRNARLRSAQRECERGQTEALDAAIGNER